MIEKLLKGNEVAQILGISRSEAYSLMRNGRIEVERFGQNVRISEEAFDITTKSQTITKTSSENLKYHPMRQTHHD